jgi:hypothetical protein
VVDLPEPVAPTMITRPRLVMTTSFSTSGRPRSSNFGIVVLITRSTMPTEPICMKATRGSGPGRQADREVGLLGGSSKLAACLSFMIARARSAVCAAVRAWLDTGVILPSILIAGGKPAVMNRSEPRLLVIRRSRSNMNLDAWSRSMCAP